MKEEWRDIPNYEGLYQVSNLGRVLCLPKEWVSGKGVIRKHNGKILKPSINKDGYYKSHLSIGGKVRTYKTHQLVAMAFLNHKPDGTHKIIVDHIDGDIKNNRIDNLQLISQRENILKSVKNKSSKLSGVSWCNPRNKWVSQIQILGKKIHLGLYKEEEKASQMYQLALKNIHLYNDDNKEFRDYLKSKLVIT